MSTLVYTKSINCMAGIIHLRSDRIIEIQVNTGIEITRDHILEILQIIRQFQLSPLPVLFNHQIPHSFTHDALVAMSQTNSINGLALWVRAGMNKKVAAILKQYAIAYPIQIFDRKKTAITWLMSYTTYPVEL